MKLTLNFNQISKSDAPIAGGKGASLGEMTQAGIAVPPGFVVLSAGFEKFLESTDLNIEIDSILHSVNIKEMHTIENASEKIKDLILKAKIPKDISKEIKKEFKNLNAEFVAVRSSATAEDSSSAAWAGQLDTFLNTTEKTLLANVQKCWASLFTPRAIFYRFEKWLHNSKISVAVVVQKMVQSEISGIAFSVHPVTQDHNQMIIEAGYGLGEAIVSGQITPDSYVVEKEPRRIIDKNITVQEKGIYRKTKDGGNEWQDISQEKGQRQKLTDEQIMELSELIIKIENHYGAPQDIEWAYEKNKFYITQSRPITTLSGVINTNQKQKINVEELVHLDVPISLVELHYEQEARATFPWSEEKFKIKPYIFYNKEGRQTYSYYDRRGIDWMVKHAGKYEDSAFAIEKIKIYFGKIEDELKQEKSLLERDFRVFLKNVRLLYPWIVYMWWAIEYKEKNRLPFDDLLAVRKNTEYFAPGLIAVLRNSTKSMFPKKKKYADVLLLSEIENKKIPDDSILKKRLKSFAYTNYKLYESWQRILDDFNVTINEQNISAENLSGQTAFAGYAKGVVRIVSKRSDILIFKDGEIIVASTTTPDYLPAMKKSAAIISEHGGAICHAAIISRELKIPCIVGVKGATKVLHDGDLVEVDADKGVVRILEKAK